MAPRTTTQQQPISAMELAIAVRGVEYPALPEQLLQTARQNHAQPDVLEFLRNLKERDYASPADLQRELSASKRS